MQKILIIEDDKVIARTLKEHLCKWDYDADFVVDFKNITEQVVSFAPQLILLDISLPYFNGFSLVRRNTQVFKCAYNIYFLGKRQNEYSYGC